MIKTSGAGGQASVPMKLFATWEMDRSAPHCIPRTCCLTICKLTVLKELDKDVQSVFIAVKMQGSKRVFRSNEIFLSSNGLVDTTLELTFSLQLIQCPVPDDSTLNLLAVQKDQDATVSVAARLLVSSMSSLPIDYDVDSERGEKQGPERSPEADNFSDDDDETLSSEPDCVSDIPNEFGEDEPSSQKRKSRRKVRVSSSSRQQNFIKTKVAALLKKFKQVSEEELDPTLVPDQDEHPVHPVDYDFLYDDLEGLNFSDSGPEMEDNISIVSTPKPKLRPFFDRISYSGSQAELDTLKEHTTTEPLHYHSGRFSPPLPSYDDKKEDAQRKIVDSWDEGRRASKNDNSLATREVEDSTARTVGSTSGNSSPDMSAGVRNEVGEKVRNRSLRDANYSLPNSKDLRPGTPQTETVTDFLCRLETEDSLPDSILLVDATDKLACLTGNALALPGIGLSKPVLTRSMHDVHLVFGAFLSRLQKYLNRNSLPLLPVKFAIVGSNVYLNLVLRQFVETLSGRSSEWQSLLLFYIIPTGSTRLSRYISSIDSKYGSIFGDVLWKESIDKLAEATNPDQNLEYLDVAAKLKEYIAEASQVLHLAIAEAMFTFRQRCVDEDSSQKFMPFISEVKVGENDVITVNDSDKEECVVSVTSAGTVAATSVASAAAANFVTPPPSPSVAVSVASVQASATASGGSQTGEVKLGLQVDYWKDKDTNKYSLKTNFKSFHVTCLPAAGERSIVPALALDVVTKGKKNLMRLPGKKGKEKETDSKSQAVGNINRLICTSKHQNSLLQALLMTFNVSTYFPPELTEIAADLLIHCENRRRGMEGCEVFPTLCSLVKSRQNFSCGDFFRLMVDLQDSNNCSASNPSAVQQARHCFSHTSA